MFQNVTSESIGIASEKVLKFIKTLDEYNFCTHSFIMARGRNIFAEGYYAPFTKEFKHRQYSISKSFVSIAVGLAVEDGLLSLEDKLVNFFPEYKNENTNGLLESMTIKDVLTMETCKDKGIWWFESGTKDRREVYFYQPADRIPGTIWI